MRLIAHTNDGTPPRTRRFLVTVNIRSDFEQKVFLAMLDDFDSGNSKYHGLVRQHAADREQGAASLRRLVQFAQGQHPMSKLIARVLLSLYDGDRFPFALASLAAIEDRELFEHCMAAVRLTNTPETMTVEAYVEDGPATFERLARRWDIKGPAPKRLSLVG